MRYIQTNNIFSNTIFRTKQTVFLVFSFFTKRHLIDQKDNQKLHFTCMPRAIPLDWEDQDPWCSTMNPSNWQLVTRTNQNQYDTPPSSSYLSCTTASSPRYLAHETSSPFQHLLQNLNRNTEIYHLEEPPSLRSIADSVNNLFVPDRIFIGAIKVDDGKSELSGLGFGALI